jgi:hypothetical protein
VAQVATDSPPATPSSAPKETLPPTPKDRRVVTEENWAPFASTDGVVLRLPSSRVELVGFHQSNHEGAQELTALASSPRWVTLESRHRFTAPRTAADIVTDPEKQVRSPVTGRIKRAGTYVLYCKYSDDYVVIEPDAHPGWEVKVLHVDHEIVRPGDRVVAGETIIAARATRLPFRSDVDALTAVPHWPHVHIEVVDPSIPNVANPGSGCS